MKITQIHFRRTLQVKPFETISYELVADVGEDTTPTSAAALAAATINDWLVTERGIILDAAARSRRPAPVADSEIDALGGGRPPQGG